LNKRTINGIDRIVYADQADFRSTYPYTDLLKDWREGHEDDWVLTDDGQVCQILKRGVLRNNKGGKTYSNYVRTAIGSFVCKDNIKMEGELRKNIYTLGKGDKTAYEIRRDREKPTKREFLFAKYVAKGDDMVDAFLKVYPTENSDYAKQESQILMNTKRIRNLIREEIDKIMNEADITPLYILEKMKDIIESDESRDSDKVSLLRELVSIAGMKDTEKRSESVTVFQGFSPEQLDAIGGKDTKKLASAKREKEV
jgi:hypothetical protein